MTLRRAASSTAVKQPQKCRQNRFRKIAEIEIHTESKQSQIKNKVSYNLLHQHKSVHNNSTQQYY